MGVRARSIVISILGIAGCGGSVAGSSADDDRISGTEADAASAGGTSGSHAGAGGAGTASGGDGGQPPDASAPPDTGAPSEGDAGTCSIREPGTPLTPEDCYSCLGTGCMDTLGNSFTDDGCARIVPDLLIDCLWYPDCFPPVTFSKMVVCESPTGCVLCYVNF